MTRRFPIGLTIATLIAFAILNGLGVWQVRRLAWKTEMLAHIAALKTAPAQPLGPVLARAARGEDVEFTRVRSDCPGLAGAGYDRIYALIEGQTASRMVSACPLSGAPYDGVLVDRGYVLDASAAVLPVSAQPAPVPVTGILRRGDGRPPRSGAAFEHSAERLWFGRHLPTIAQHLGLTRPAPYFLMAETSSNPELKALVPAGVPADIPNNHLSYAITWFGLAAALAGVYAALLWKKMQGR